MKFIDPHMTLLTIYTSRLELTCKPVCPARSLLLKICFNRKAQHTCNRFSSCSKWGRYFYRLLIDWSSSDDSHKCVVHAAEWKANTSKREWVTSGWSREQQGFCSARQPSVPRLSSGRESSGLLRPRPPNTSTACSQDVRPNLLLACNKTDIYKHSLFYKMLYWLIY